MPLPILVLVASSFLLAYVTGCTAAPVQDDLLDPPFLDAGTYSGELTFPVDNADHYRFLGPKASLVVVEFSTQQPLRFRLIDGDGTIRACSHLAREGVLTAISTTTDVWNLQMDLGSCVGWRNLLPLTSTPPETLEVIRYSFTLRTEQHEHVGVLKAPLADARSVQAQFQEGTFGRLDLEYGLDLATTRSWALVTHFRMTMPGQPPEEGTFSFSVRPDAGLSDPVIFASVPGRVTATLEMTPHLRFEPPARVIVENRLRAGDVSVGVAFSEPFAIRALLLWDGPEPLLNISYEDYAVFVTAGELEPEAAAGRIGPWVVAPRGTFTWTFGEGWAFVKVDADDPRVVPGVSGATANATVLIRTPWAERITVTEGQRSWRSTQSLDLKGGWDLEVRDVSGLWGDTIILSAVEFDIHDQSGRADSTRESGTGHISGSRAPASPIPLRA